jgi:hypothetical protein
MPLERLRHLAHDIGVQSCDAVADGGVKAGFL